MKIKILLVSTLLTTIGIVGCQTGGPVGETSVGIGADGVFNDPSPSTFDYPTTKAGESDRIAKSYHTAPPMVPHTVAEYLPITMETNECMECHSQIGWIPSTFDHNNHFVLEGAHIAIANNDECALIAEQ